MPRRITMRDVARHLGLDPSTVSLALRSHSRIPKATREKIRAAADMLGYQPDPMLGALACYRRAQHTAPIASELAWVNRWTPPERLHAFREFDGYWRGAAAAASEAGYRLVDFRLGDGPLERLRRQLLARNIAGLVIPPHHGACNVWDGLDCTHFSVVRIGHSVALPTHAVGCDQTDAAILGFHRIHEHGYQRIGFVTHPGAEHSSRFRAGYLFAQENTSGIAHLPTLLLHEKNHEADRSDLARWLTEHRPDAVFTASARVRALLGELGRSVPGDMALAATSVLDGNADAGIDQRPEEIGRAAIELLDSLLAHGRRGLPAVPRMMTVGARWVDGATLPAIMPSRSTG